MTSEVACSVMSMNVSPYSTDTVGSGAEGAIPQPPYIVVDGIGEAEEAGGIPSKDDTCEGSRLRDLHFYNSLKAMRRQLDTLENLFASCCLGK